MPRKIKPQGVEHRGIVVDKRDVNGISHDAPLLSREA